MVLIFITYCWKAKEQKCVTNIYTAEAKQNIDLITKKNGTLSDLNNETDTVLFYFFTTIVLDHFFTATHLDHLICDLSEQLHHLHLKSSDAKPSKCHLKF